MPCRSVLRFAGISSPPEALTRCINCQWATDLDEYRTGGLKYVSLLPFVNESSRWRPVFRAHISMCLSIGLGQFNRSSHINPGLLRDQGHKTPSLQKAKTHITLSSPSATQPLRHSARSPVSPTSSTPPAKKNLPFSYPLSRTLALIPRRPAHPLPHPPVAMPTSAQSNCHRSHPSSPLKP